jgi:hypothetical protein
MGDCGVNVSDANTPSIRVEPEPRSDEARGDEQHERDAEEDTR